MMNDFDLDQWELDAQNFLRFMNNDDRIRMLALIERLRSAEEALRFYQDNRCTAHQEVDRELHSLEGYKPWGTMAHDYFKKWGTK